MSCHAGVRPFSFKITRYLIKNTPNSYSDHCLAEGEQAFKECMIMVAAFAPSLIASGPLVASLGIGGGISGCMLVRISRMRYCREQEKKRGNGR